MNILRNLVSLLLVSICFHATYSQNRGSCQLPAYEGDPFANTYVIPTPQDPAKWDQWRDKLFEWREKAMMASNHSDSLYNLPEFEFVKSSFVSTKIILWDEEFFDWKAGKYTPEKFIEEGKRRFGGYDNVLLWHSYIRLGFDERNQFDFYRDMPGGLEELKRLVKIFHDNGINVTINYNPWDIGTKREDKNDFDALIEVLKTINADGVYLDTWHNGPDEFFVQMNKEVRPGMIYETENNQCIANLKNHHFEWLEEYYTDSYVPGIIRNKWFERKHMMHIDLRNQKDKIPFLHLAWMNGTGILVWENVFSQWMGWSKQEEQILKSMVPVQRRYVDVFTGEGWEPFIPTLEDGVFANKWYTDALQIWTVVNRNSVKVEASILEIKQQKGQNIHYFDLISGKKLEVVKLTTETIRDERGLEKTSENDNIEQITLKCSLMPRGIAAVIAIDEKDIDNDFRYFLFQQSIIALNNHNYYNSEKKEPLEALNFPAPTPKYAMNKLPSGMILMPHGKHPVIIEKVDRPIFYLYLDTPMERITDFTLFAIDTKPVTNLEYYQFLQSSGYEPEFKENFLVHWNGARPPKSIENEPVVYVDLNDARAYASWMKKRLPTEEEWVLAMNTKKPDYHNKRVWEWNESERSNGQSRWCTLHGGSFYNATGSIHYADGGPMEPKMGSKYMLMWPGLDRCSTIGFRCVVDVLNK